MSIEANLILFAIYFLVGFFVGGIRKEGKKHE